MPLVEWEFHLGSFYFIVAFLLISGFANAVNLTDGLDGLAAGTVAISLLAYTGITFLSGERDLALLSASLMGACIGFLWFNSFPAEIFMGDTGSLALGAALAGLALVTGTELLLVLIGAIFVGEALSVIIQVVSFRIVAPPGVPHGADPSPFRTQELVGDQDHRALLDRRRDLRVRGLHHVLRRTIG